MRGEVSKSDQLTDLQRKWLRWVVLVGLVVLVGMVVWQQVSRIGKVAVDVKFAPFNAVVTIDGREVRNGRTVWLREGEFEMRVELEGFETVERNVVVQEGWPILGGMLAISDVGRDMAVRRSRDFMIVEGFAGDFARREGMREREDWPILRYLPVRNMLFSIGSEIDDESLVIVVRPSSSAYQEAAVRELFRLSSDVDPTEYRVRIEGERNPFRRGGE